MNTYKSIVNTLSKRGYLTLLALLIAITSFAQEITVNGTVLDETDTPLIGATIQICLLYTSPSPRDTERSRMPSSA